MRDFFAFRTMITGSVIQVVFVLGLIGIVIAGIGAIANDQAPAGLLILVFGLLYWRILCELLIVVFRMNSSLTAIRANTAGLAPALPGGGTTDPGSVQVEELAAAEATAIAVPAASTAALPPAGWYDDSERPGHKRWWGGTTWGVRDDEHASMASGSARPDAEIAAPSPTSQPETGQDPADTATAVGPVSETAPAAASSPTPEPASPSAPTRFCENCGAERSGGGNFCTNCGHAD